MQKLGMKPVSGITRVTIKRSKNVCITSTLLVTLSDPVCNFSPGCVQESCLRYICHLWRSQDWGPRCYGSGCRCRAIQGCRGCCRRNCFKRICSCCHWRCLDRRAGRVFSWSRWYWGNAAAESQANESTGCQGTAWQWRGLDQRFDVTVQGLIFSILKKHKWPNGLLVSSKQSHRDLAVSQHTKAQLQILEASRIQHLLLLFLDLFLFGHDLCHDHGLFLEE